MIKFPSMYEYTEWFMKKAVNLNQYEMRIVFVESIKKSISVCGTPLAIEYIAERAAGAFIKEWNEATSSLEIEEAVLDEDKDDDLISDLREVILNTLEQYMNMEVVYVSTEY